ncbi:MAG: glycosyltransferase family 4 protein [Candidatus Omnitrophota bacterium]|nr:glycosyltransferase family 4 protein [Candidatus Omnitrophota bacterium]
MIRVLHVNTHMNIGGIGQYIVSLAKALKQKRVECFVASSGGELLSELVRLDIRHIRLDINTKFEFGPKVFRSASDLTRIVKDNKIDLVHAHTRVSQVASYLASRRAGIPYIATCHGYFNAKLSRRLFDTWGEKVVAISEAVRRHLEKDFNVNRQRIEVIYNGIDLGRFSNIYSADRIATAKRSLGIQGGVVVGTMGRLSSVKGQKFLVEAMKEVVSKSKDARCLIIGSGREEAALKDLAKSLGLETRVIFTGAAYMDIPLYLACMDIFVLPSIEEGLGLALLEAMSLGRPCVASATGGIRDIVNDGVNGILTPVGDSNAIANAVLRILNDKPLAKNISESSRDFVRGRFSIEAMADKMIDLYGGVIRAKH